MAPRQRAALGTVRARAHPYGPRTGNAARANSGAYGNPAFAPAWGQRPTNARIIDEFIRGKPGVGADNVLAVTISVISNCGGDWEAALDCLNALERCKRGNREIVKPTVNVFNAAISACGRAKQVDQALELFDEMAGRGFFPDIFTYNAVISACGKGGRTDVALEKFQHLLEHGPADNVFPNTITYNAVISACGMGGLADAALEKFKHLLKYGPNYKYKVFPDTITYNAVISACEKGKRPREALKVFDHLRDHGPYYTVKAFPDIITYSAVISACGTGGYARKALNVFNHLLDHGPDRGVFPDVVAYSAVISACGMGGYTREALKVFDHLLKYGPKYEDKVFPNIITYSAMISACGTDGYTRKALDVFNHLLDHGPYYKDKVFPNTIAYNAVISACEKGGRADEARKVFDHMLHHGKERGVFPDSITYTAVISACEKAGRHGAVSDLLEKAIRAEVFNPSLGFEANRNQLNFHESAVVTQPTSEASEDRGVAAPVAKGIFRRLLSEGRIGHETQFVVGQHGGDVLKNTIEQCMRDQGWTPEHPLDPWGQPNLGRLRAAALQLQPGGPGRTGTKGLNPMRPSSSLHGREASGSSWAAAQRSRRASR
jgi:pentatricopeptide repeat protein